MDHEALSKSLWIDDSNPHKAIAEVVAGLDEDYETAVVVWRWKFQGRRVMLERVIHE